MTTTTLPKAYENETSFNDMLYAWINSAPWLAISGAFHLLLLFILSAFPWESIQRQEPPLLNVGAIEIIDEPLLEPPVEPLDPIVPEQVVELQEPVLTEVVADDTAATESDLDSPFASESDALSNAPFNGDQLGDVIGLGPGGGGGGFEGRGASFRGGRTSKAAHNSITMALEWLAAHQDTDGSWDCDGFSNQCGQQAGNICSGAGRAGQDVGVTGLALLAFLGIGTSPGKGEYGDNVARAVLWLRNSQDPETGLIGDAISHEYLYGHAIATLALCEVYYETRSPLLRSTCQKAVWYIQRARNPYGAWRYSMPPNGESDTSVTGWMVFALKAASEAGLEVDPGGFEGAASWLDEATDMGSGRVGYNQVGSKSSRITGINDHFPTETGEAMTAVGLLSRIFIGQDDAKKYPILSKHQALLKRSMPTWDPDGLGNDMYYWYYGTYAMYQMGGSAWNAWEARLGSAVIKSQIKSGDEKGSWDPSGPWGFSGGRVYSTALMALTCEVYFRYERTLGSR